MKKTSRTARLITAAFATAMTLAIFSSVVSIAEPQRGELMAKTQHIEQAPSTMATMALAST
ncbi:MAG: hypothetical protein ABIS68_06100 [Casimicrobiaceae bacterium]